MDKQDLLAYGLIKFHNDLTKLVKTLPIDFSEYDFALEAKPDGMSWHITKKQPKEDGKNIN